VHGASLRAGPDPGGTLLTSPGRTTLCHADPCRVDQQPGAELQVRLLGDRLAGSLRYRRGFGPKGRAVLPRKPGISRVCIRVRLLDLIIPGSWVRAPPAPLTGVAEALTRTRDDREPVKELVDCLRAAPLSSHDEVVASSRLQTLARMPILTS
jgi:hypothetical protein